MLLSSLASVFICLADCDPTHDDGFQGNDLLHSSQESLLGMTEDSISSMDIDLNALEKVSSWKLLSSISMLSVFLVSQDLYSQKCGLFMYL